MPVTACSICGGEWQHPSGWWAHLHGCSPARKQQAAAAVRSLILALEIQTQAKETGRYVNNQSPQDAR